MDAEIDLTTRQQTLEAAAACILKDRNSTYGSPENSFRDIAAGWSLILGNKMLAGTRITGTEAALMMAWLKIVRAKDNPAHADSFVDLVGYGACAAELAENETAVTVPPA
jgi:hypothetical protein